MDFDLTKEEKSAIRRLKRLAKDWPDTLWLFSASGSLYVMKSGENREHVETENGSMDADYEVEIIDIENDGGDW